MTKEVSMQIVAEILEETYSIRCHACGQRMVRYINNNHSIIPHPNQEEWDNFTSSMEMPFIEVWWCSTDCFLELVAELYGVEIVY